MPKPIELFGWYGAIAIIGAYAMVSFSLLSATSIWYQLLNATGAIGIASVSLHKKAYQPGLLNIIWALIAIAAIIKFLQS